MDSEISNSDTQRQDDKVPGIEQLEEVLTTQKFDESQNTDFEHDGGFIGWLQVIGSFALFFNTWGIVNAFGVFQTFYYEGISGWEETASNISWIGSVQSFLLLCVGIMAGALYDAGYFRVLVLVGTLLVPFGLAMTSICQTFWQTMLAQGFAVGIGTACLYVPSVAILPQYFSRRLALANGVAASGSGIGGVIYPIMLARLENDIGFAWATRAVALVALVTLSFALCVMRPRQKPSRIGKWIEASAFKHAPYTLFTAGVFFAFMGFFVPFYYIQTFAAIEGLVDDTLNFYLLPIMCASSTLGVVLPNYFSDHFGPLNVLIVASILTTVLALVWIAVKTMAGLVIFAVLYGVFSGAFVSLPAVAVISLTSNFDSLGVCIGQTFFVAGFGLLIGAPVSGQLFTVSEEFLGLQLFTALNLVVATGLCVAARFLMTGFSLRVKV